MATAQINNMKHDTYIQLRQPMHFNGTTSQCWHLRDQGLPNKIKSSRLKSIPTISYPFLILFNPNDQPVGWCNAALV